MGYNLINSVILSSLHHCIHEEVGESREKVKAQDEINFLDAFDVKQTQTIAESLGHFGTDAAAATWDWRH